jgi:hypothetical protein
VNQKPALEASLDRTRAKAYAAAEKTLRETHADEFAKMYQAECEKAGIAFRPRLSPIEKARKQIADLQAQFPELREQTIDFPDQP